MGTLAEPFDGAGRHVDASQRTRTIVIIGEVDEPAVGRPRRFSGVPVQCLSQHPGFAAAGRNDRDPGIAIRPVLRVATPDVDDPFAVRAVACPPAIAPDESRQLLRFGPDSSLDRVDIRVVVPVAAGCPLAGEDNLFPIGRPTRLGVVEIAPGQLLGLSGGDVEEIEVVATRPNVADVVTLEVPPVDLDRLRGLLFRGFRRVGIGILNHENQPLRVRRPGVVVDPALRVGHLDRFAPQPIEQPQLGALLAVAPAAQEAEIPIIRAPFRIRLTVGRRGQLDRPGAVPAHHIDVGVPLVLGRVCSGDRVGHPLPVRGKDRVGDIFDPIEVAQRQPAFDRHLGSHYRGNEQQQGKVSHIRFALSSRSE